MFIAFREFSLITMDQRSIVCERINLLLARAPFSVLQDCCDGVSGVLCQDTEDVLQQFQRRGDFNQLMGVSGGQDTPCRVCNAPRLGTPWKLRRDTGKTMGTVCTPCRWVGDHQCLCIYCCVSVGWA